MKRILSLILARSVIWLTFFGLWNVVTAIGAGDVWINMTDDCLSGMWSWCMDYGKMMWIDKEQPDYTPTTIVQDVILAATYMVWTVLTVVIIYCWLMYIFASRWWKSPEAYKDWLKNAAIWAVLVRWAYAIVRLIQYIARW